MARYSQGAGDFCDLSGTRNASCFQGDKAKDVNALVGSEVRLCKMQVREQLRKTFFALPVSL
jgi:hypothetical protein